MNDNVRRGRHRPGRVDEPHDTLRLRQRPVWPLTVPAGGRHHVASGPLLAGLHDLTVRIPAQRRPS